MKVVSVVGNPSYLNPGDKVIDIEKVIEDHALKAMPSSGIPPTLDKGLFNRLVMQLALLGALHGQTKRLSVTPYDGRRLGTQENLFAFFRELLSKHGNTDWRGRFVGELLRKSPKDYAATTYIINGPVSESEPAGKLLKQLYGDSFICVDLSSEASKPPVENTGSPPTEPVESEQKRKPGRPKKKQ